MDGSANISFLSSQFCKFLCVFSAVSNVGLNHEQGLELDFQFFSGVEFRGGLSMG